MNDKLSSWLDALGLAQYLPLFEQNGIDLRSLPLLAESDLAELGVLLGHRKLLTKAISALNGEPPTLPAGPPTPTAPEPAAPVANDHRRRAERRQLTVMFCDLVGSTDLAQSLDPETLREVMQAYQQACTGVVAPYDGHVAQYLGDGLMIYFGWPSAHEDDAERAVRAGLQIVEAVRQIATPPGISPLRVRIGIATGSVVVGETGDGDAAIPKAAIGETPNLAARLQAFAKADQILVAASTQRLLGSAFHLTSLGEQALKGIQAPVAIWQVDDLNHTQSRLDFSCAAQGMPIGGLTPYVGREEEVSLLLARWRQACAGEGHLALLSGEPGIGKSRIVQVLREHLASQPHVWLRYQCSPYHVASALYPIIEQLKYAAGFERNDPAEVKLDKLEAGLAVRDDRRLAVAPLVAALLGLPGERYHPGGAAPMLSPQRQNELILLSLVEQAEHLASRLPVLLLFEDIHWIDPTTLDLLNLLVERVRNHAIMLVFTYRPDFVPPWVGHSHVTALSLNRLSRREGAEVVLKVTGGKALPEDVLERILARTDGVPLFVEELTINILEAGVLTDAGSHYTLDGPLPPLAVPATLQDSLMARLDRLGPVKEVAQVAACIGREFRYELLAQISSLPDAELQAALAHLVHSGLVFCRGIPPDADYRFKHALVQQTAYDSLLLRRRQHIHHQIADALPAHASETVRLHPELLAQHLTAAGRIAEALPQWLAGARLAAAGSRYQEALSHVGAGLALVDQAPDAMRDNLEVALLVTGASCHFALAGYGSVPAGELLRRVEAKLDLVTAADVLSGALSGIGVLAWVRSDFAVARSSFERLMALAEASGDANLLVYASQAFGCLLVSQGELERARPLLEFVIDHYDTERHWPFVAMMGHDIKVASCSFLGTALAYSGRLDQARRCATMAVAHATELHHPFSLGMALGQFAMIEAQYGGAREAMVLAQRCIALCEEQHLPFWSGWAGIAEGVALAREGSSEQAARRLGQAKESLHATGTTNCDTIICAWQALALAYCGRFAEARQEAETGAKRTGEPLWELMCHYALEITDFVDPAADSSSAEHRLLESIEGVRRLGASMLELRFATGLARQRRAQGKAKAAQELLAPLYARFTEGHDGADLREAAKLLAQLEIDLR